MDKTALVAYDTIIHPTYRTMVRVTSVPGHSSWAIYVYWLAVSVCTRYTYIRWFIKCEPFWTSKTWKSQKLDHVKVLHASVLLYIQCMVYTQLLGGMTQLLARLPRNHSDGSSNPFKAFLPNVSLSKKFNPLVQCWGPTVDWNVCVIIQLIFVKYSKNIFDWSSCCAGWNKCTSLFMPKAPVNISISDTKSHN